MAKTRFQKEKTRSRLQSATIMSMRPLNRLKLWVMCSIALGIVYLFVDQMYKIPRWNMQRRNIEVTTTEDMSKYMTGWLVPRLLTKPQDIPTPPSQSEDIDKPEAVISKQIETQGLMYREKPVEAQTIPKDLSGFIKGEELSSINITNLKIYVYPLPELLNRDLKRCAEQNEQNEMCLDLSNDGFGSTAYIYEQISSHVTHKFSLEVLFHENLKISSLVTSDPRMADLFYIPYYAAMNCFCTNPSNKNFDVLLWDILLRENTYLMDGKPHFMAIGNSRQEMSSPSCPFFVNQRYSNLIFLIPENTMTTDSANSRLYFSTSNNQNNTILVPYPSYLHFNTPDAEIEIGYRSLFTVMIASTTTSTDDQLSSLLISQVSESRYRHTMKYMGHFYRMPLTDCLDRKKTSLVVTDLLRRALFCLQPPGEIPPKKSFYDALLSGCIPVVFQTGIDFPFSDMLNYNTFTLYIDPKEILENRADIVKILRKVPRRQVKQMQQTIKTIAKFLQYGLYEGEDAFTMSMREVIRAFGMEKFTGHPTLNPKGSIHEVNKKEPVDKQTLDPNNIRPVVEKDSYSYDDYMERTPDKELTRNEEYAAIYGGKDNYQAAGNGGRPKQVLGNNGKELRINKDGGKARVRIEQTPVEQQTSVQRNESIDEGAMFEATVTSTNTDTNTDTPHETNLAENVDVDNIDPNNNNIAGTQTQMDSLPVQYVQFGAYTPLTHVHPPSDGNNPPINNGSPEVDTDPTENRIESNNSNMNAQVIPDNNAETPNQDNSLMGGGATLNVAQTHGSPLNNFDRNWKVSETKIGGIRVENMPPPMKELVSYRSDGIPVVLKDNGYRPVSNAPPDNGYQPPEDKGKRPLGNKAPVNDGYRPSDPVNNEYKPADNTPIDNGYKAVENSPVGNGYRPVNNAPVDNGYRLVNNAPVDNGYRPVNTAPVDNGYRPVNNAPVGNGYRPVNNAPVGNGYRPVNNAPVDNGYRPVNNAPVGNGYRPVNNAPVGNGYRPVNNAPVGNGYRPVNNAPINNGYRPVDRAAVNNGYRSLNAPVNTVYKPVKTLRQVNNAPVNNGYKAVNNPVNNGFAVAPINDAQIDNGYRPINNAPVNVPVNNQYKQVVNTAQVNNGYRPVNNAPGDNGHVPISNGYKQAPVNKVYRPVVNNAQENNGYRPTVNNAQDNNGYRPVVNNAQVNNGYRKVVNDLPVNNGYKPLVGNILENNGYEHNLVRGLGNENNGYKPQDGISLGNKGSRPSLANHGYKLLVETGLKNNGYRPQTKNQIGSNSQPNELKSEMTNSIRYQMMLEERNRALYQNTGTQTQNNGPLLNTEYKEGNFQNPINYQQQFGTKNTLNSPNQYLTKQSQGQGQGLQQHTQNPSLQGPPLGNFPKVPQQQYPSQGHFNSQGHWNTDQGQASAHGIGRGQYYEQTKVSQQGQYLQNRPNVPWQNSVHPTAQRVQYLRRNKQTPLQYLTYAPRVQRKLINNNGHILTLPKDAVNQETYQENQKKMM